MDWKLCTLYEVAIKGTYQHVKSGFELTRTRDKTQSSIKRTQVENTFQKHEFLVVSFEKKRCYRWSVNFLLKYKVGTIDFSHLYHLYEILLTFKVQNQQKTDKI